MNYKKLGLILKNARVSSGLSQAQVSKYINKTSQNISSWELGKSKIDIDSFERLCHLYDISFTDTLNALTNDQNIDYLKMSDDDVIEAYKSLDGDSKAFIKHAIYSLSYKDSSFP